MHAPREVSRRAVPGRWLFLLLFIPLILYLALPTCNYYWDGVGFAVNIEKDHTAASLLYPSHLLYNLWGAWLYRLSELLGFRTRALFLMQAANGVLAGLCVFMLSECLRLRKVAASLAVAWALVFGFSATWWRFASDANAYVPCIFLLLCAWVLLERYPRGVILAGLATASAMLFHELAILFIPVAVMRLRRSGRPGWTYVAAALVPVVIAYPIAFRAASHDTTLSGFFAWITIHSPDSGFSFNVFKDAALTIRGSLRLFFGGKLGDFVRDRVSWAAAAALMISIVAFCARSVRQEFSISRPSRHLMLWTGIYAAFLFFWMPQNTFYRLFYLPPLILILATMLRSTLVWFFLPVLLFWNFVFLVYPQSRPEFNVPRRFALAQRDTWTRGTPVAFHQFHPDLWTISYFAPQAVWIGIDRGDPAEAERALEYAHAENKTLWLEETAYDLIAANPDGRRWLAEHEHPDELMEFKDDKHDFRFHSMH